MAFPQVRFPAQKTHWTALPVTAFPQMHCLAQRRHQTALPVTAFPQMHCLAQRRHQTALPVTAFPQMHFLVRGRHQTALPVTAHLQTHFPVLILCSSETPVRASPIMKSVPVSHRQHPFVPILRLKHPPVPELPHKFPPLTMLPSLKFDSVLGSDKRPALPPMTLVSAPRYEGTPVSMLPLMNPARSHRIFPPDLNQPVSKRRFRQKSFHKK